MTIADTLFDAALEVRENYLGKEDTWHYSQNTLYPEILRVLGEMDALREKLERQGPEEPGTGFVGKGRRW